MYKDCLYFYILAQFYIYIMRTLKPFRKHLKDISSLEELKIRKSATGFPGMGKGIFL